MRLLANENVPLLAVEALRALGHDVLWVREASPGSLDPQVVARAVAEQRVLLTLDKDFGELAFRSKLSAPCGVVLLRVRPPWPAEVASLVTEVVAGGRDFAGQFVVAERGRLRTRPIPE